MRGLLEPFLRDLEEGILHPVLDRVRRDDTLMLAIRDGYVNVYYRGGNILRLKPGSAGVPYTAFFDVNYRISESVLPDLPGEILDTRDASAWVGGFPLVKQAMDEYFSERPKPEREFQQLAARENNRSPISGQTEYFISDIEFADAVLGARFDMLAIRWLSSDRKQGRDCRAALIEMKYGDDAITGASGLLKHLQDIERFLADEGTRRILFETMTAQFNQLDRLGLLRFNKGSSNARVVVSDEKPEVIFLLANHNPRSRRLRSVLEDPAFVGFSESPLFDLRFYTASFSGYGMHADCMRTLPELLAMMRGEAVR